MARSGLQITWPLQQGQGKLNDKLLLTMFRTFSGSTPEIQLVVQSLPCYSGPATGAYMYTKQSASVILQTFEVCQQTYRSWTSQDFRQVKGTLGNFGLHVSAAFMQPTTKNVQTDYEQIRVWDTRKVSWARQSK